MTQKCWWDHIRVKVLISSSPTHSYTSCQTKENTWGWISFFYVRLLLCYDFRKLMTAMQQKWKLCRMLLDPWGVSKNS